MDSITHLDFAPRLSQSQIGFTVYFCFLLTFTFNQIQMTTKKNNSAECSMNFDGIAINVRNSCDNTSCKFSALCFVLYCLQLTEISTNFCKI